MKKLVLFSMIVFGLSGALSRAHAASAVTNNANVQIVNTPSAQVYPRPYRVSRPVVLTSGVNYIDREIKSGKVKQVVQAGPTPVYYSPYFY